MDVPAEARHLAEATFLKKRMYYNMRVKSTLWQTKQLEQLAEMGLAQRLSTLTARRERVDLLYRAYLRQHYHDHPPPTTTSTTTNSTSTTTNSTGNNLTLTLTLTSSS